MTDIAFSPLENRDTEQFWKASKEGRLVIQQCTACATFRHPPSPVCHSCLSFDHEWVESAGRGKVWSFSVVRERVEGWPGDVPLVVVIIELALISLGFITRPIRPDLFRSVSALVRATRLRISINEC